MHFYTKRKGGTVVRKYWVKARRKPSRTNSKCCNFVYTKGLLGSNSSGLTLLQLCWLQNTSLGLVPRPVCSSAWQVSYCYGHLPTSWSPMQFMLHLPRFSLWLLWASMQRFPCIHLALAVLTSEEDSTTPYSCILQWLKPEPYGWSSCFNEVLACLGYNLTPLFELHLHKVSFVVAL